MAFDIYIEPLDPRWNFLQSGEVYFLLDSANSIYALTPQDGLLWQQAFEAGFRDDLVFPALSETGEVYLADREGILYGFNRTGLSWTYDPGGNLRTASDPAIGPDGNLYYVVTSGGTYTRVYEDFVDLESGRYPIEFPFEVNRFISGDGS
jgi:outer membrane protein assembly factor BamB